MNPRAANPFFPGLLVILALSACTRPDREPPPRPDRAAQQATIAAWADWSARGRLALKLADGGGQADFDWQQRGEDALIRVSGPFGVGAWEIRWNASELSVRNRDGSFSERYMGADAAERFLEARLGWSLPALNTRWWLRGLADPAYPAYTVFAADGTPASIAQNGWTVSYAAWRTADGLQLPARLTLESERARLRLVVDRWQYGRL
ncbi:MAG: outer membrane lipoprotein LolB [Gammaproteobacteria bacterium]|nr:outer membrane lipoprotein LolB [Gammaproteobacteria bacterium]